MLLKSFCRFFNINFCVGSNLVPYQNEWGGGGGGSCEGFVIRLYTMIILKLIQYGALDYFMFKTCAPPVKYM